MKKLTVLAGAAILAAALPGVASAHRGPAMKMTYKAMLSGKNEVGTKGPKTGTGMATITIDVAKNRLCYSISVKGIDLPAVAAHIHQAKAGVNGNVVVPFATAPAKNGKAVGCRKVSATVLKAIEKNPKNYYVNVHTAKYSNGAVRGQL